MGTGLLIVDKGTDGTIVNELVVDFLSERITVRELIRGGLMKRLNLGLGGKLVFFGWCRWWEGEGIF